MQRPELNINSATIAQAAQRIKPFVFRTPILVNDTINELTGAKLLFKCENLQRIGAFKARGAINAVLQLSEENKERGVATHSSGNHAQALALAAKTIGIDAHIVMPENSPQIKIDGVKKLNGQIVFCKPNLESRETTLNEVIKNTGATFIPPYNHQHIIAGQGTAALEFIEDGPSLDAILAPLGGGGLLSGTALSSKYWSPSTKVYGCEPEVVDDGLRSFRSGKIEPNEPDAHTIADGLRTQLGDLTLYFIREHVHDILTVTESEIVEAMEIIWKNLKVIIEPSAAVPFAAVLKNREKFKNCSVGIILSGGNVDLAKVPFLQE